MHAGRTRYEIAQSADTSAMACELALHPTANTGGSSLDRAGKAGDVVFDEERVDERHGNRPEQCSGHELAPIKHIATDEFRDDADWHGAHSGFCLKDQCVEKLVLRQGESEDTGRNEARHAQWEEDLHYRL